MIDTRQIRVGNIVLFEGKYHRWQENDFLDKAIRINGQYVRLSPEILEKSGFVSETGRHGYEYWYPNENALWSIRQEGNGNWQFCMVQIDGSVMKFDPIIASLHWLQNVHYFLTGNELTITLP